MAEKDFFISYNQADEAWAVWIAWQLEEADYSTDIQAWDFRPGGNFVLDMQKAAETCQRVIAVLSPDYLSSIYTAPEWSVAFAKDPTGSNRLLLPIRVRTCEPKGLLAQIVYVDLVDVDETSAQQLLLAGVQGRVKPNTNPVFPGLRIGVTPPPNFPGPISTPSSHVGFKDDVRRRIPNPQRELVYLVNRDEQMKQIEECFEARVHAKSSRPFVCVLPGYIEDSHEAFLEGFKLGLPSLLRNNNYHDVFRDPVPWSIIPKSTNPRRDLSRELTRYLNLPSSASQVAISDAIRQIREHLVFYCTFTCENWDKTSEDLLIDWIDFWLELPDLDPAQLVIIFLWIKRICKPTSTTSKFKIINKLFGSSAPAVSEINLKSLERRYGQHQPDIITLQHLHSLNKHHVNKWASVKLMSHGYRWIDTVYLSQEVMSVFQNESELRMKDLIEPLYEKLCQAHHRYKENNPI